MTTARRSRRPDLAAALDLVLPLECAACARPGSRWCRRCEVALRALALSPTGARVELAAHAATPHRMPGADLPVFAWGAYRPPLDAVVTAWKDGGRRDLSPLLAGLLADAVRAALTDVAGAWLVVPVPSSRRAVRQRGDAPLVALGEAAPRRLPPDLADRLRPAPALAHGRTVVDQSRLGTVDRLANLHGSMRVDPRWAAVVASRRCLVVDDVVTTGSTVVEAERALRAAGARAVRVAVVAATPRRNALPTWAPTTSPL